MIYTFAPTPPASYFREALGDGVLAAKILPNVVDRIGKLDMAPIGTNFISLDPAAVWPEAEREILARLSANLSIRSEEVAAILAKRNPRFAPPPAHPAGLYFKGVGYAQD